MVEPEREREIVHLRLRFLMVARELLELAEMVDPGITLSRAFEPVDAAIRASRTEIRAFDVSSRR